MRLFFYDAPMQSETNIRTALAAALEKRGEQGKIAKCLDVHSTTVKRWSEGETIPDPMQKLLAWYLFGEAPPSMTHKFNLQDALVFDEIEWRMITIQASREGITQAQWIASRIRSYLAYQNTTTTPILRAAEEQTTYKAKKKSSS